MEKTDQHSSLDSSPLGEGAAGLSAKGGEAPDEISIKEIIIKFQEWLKYLLSKWLIILIFGILGGVLGLVYANSKKIFYTAELSFVLEDGQSGGAGGYSGLASMVGIDLGSGGGGVFVGDNLIEFMRSRAMIEKTLLTSINWNNKKQTLAEFYIDLNDSRSGWEDKPDLKDIQFLADEDRSNYSREKDSVLASFYRSISGSSLAIEKKDKKLSIIVASFKSENEVFSKYFVETLVKVVSDFYVETKTKKAAQNLYVLQRQTDSVRRELNSAISGVASSIDFNPKPNPSRKVLGVPSERRKVDVQANQVILTELVKNLEISKVSLRKETPLIQVIDSPILPLDRERFGRGKGVISGGIIAGFLITVLLILKKLITDILS